MQVTREHGHAGRSGHSDSMFASSRKELLRKRLQRAGLAAPGRLDGGVSTPFLATIVITTTAAVVLGQKGSSRNE